LFEAGAILQELIHPNFNPPRQGDAKRASPTFQSYAKTLANLGNPQDDDAFSGGIAPPPPRPIKRNVQMVYDLQGEYPNLPRHHNQTQRTQSPNTTIPTNVSPDQATSAKTHPAQHNVTCRPNSGI
jgi:hypothetical protein